MEQNIVTSFSLLGLRLVFFPSHEVGELGNVSLIISLNPSVVYIYSKPFFRLHHLDEDGGGELAAGDQVHGLGVSLVGEVKAWQSHHPGHHWVQVVRERVAH